MRGHGTKRWNCFERKDPIRLRKKKKKQTGKKDSNRLVGTLPPWEQQTNMEGPKKTKPTIKTQQGKRGIRPFQRRVTTTENSYLEEGQVQGGQVITHEEKKSLSNPIRRGYKIQEKCFHQTNKC